MVAVVTGATVGIGLAVARLLVQEGVPVVLTGRNIQAGEAAAEDLRQLRGSSRVAFAPLDMLSPDVAPVVEAVRALGDEEGGEQEPPRGPLSLLVNNAAVALDTPWLEVPEEARADVGERTLKTNYHGLVEVTNALKPLLRSHEGTIIHVSSGAAYLNMDKTSPAMLRRLGDIQSQEELSALAEEFLSRYKDETVPLRSQDPKTGFHLQSYGFTKALLNRLTEIQAAAWPELKVVCCTPGFIKTRMTTGYAQQDALIDPEAGARTVLAARAATSGRFFGPQGEREAVLRP